MKLKPLTSPCLRLLCLAWAAPLVSVANGKARRSQCDCADDVRPSFLGDLQLLERSAETHGRAGRRPRDCTCINGMKTHATTPRDELLGMGPVALGRHYDSCKRKLEGLEKQKEYAVAESEVRIKKANKEAGKSKKLLENTKNANGKDRVKLKAEKGKLMKEVGSLEKDITSLNSKYNEEFSAWWTLKDDMKERLSRAKVCNCQKKKFLLLQTSRAGFHFSHLLSPDQDYMYDTAHKVEECETKVNKLSDEIAKAEASGRKAMITGLEDRKAFGRRLADQQHLSKLLDQKPLVDKLRKTKSHLERTAKTQREKVEKYKATNAEIEKGIKQLDTELKSCGCSKTDLFLKKR